MAGFARRAARALRLLQAEQRVAAVAAVLLIVSTIGPAFSFVEAAEIVLALGVVALLVARAEGKRFHLPFGDGTVIAAAGVWAGALIVARLLDRSLGLNLLALACAALLFLAGARERAKRPPDDVPDAARPGAAGVRGREPPGDITPEGRGASPPPPPPRAR